MDGAQSIVQSRTLGGAIKGAAFCALPALLCNSHALGGWGVPLAAAGTAVAAAKFSHNRNCGESAFDAGMMIGCAVVGGAAGIVCGIAGRFTGVAGSLVLGGLGAAAGAWLANW